MLSKLTDFLTGTGNTYTHARTHTHTRSFILWNHDLNNCNGISLDSCPKWCFYVRVPLNHSEKSLCSFVCTDVDLPATEVFAFRTDQENIKLPLPGPG